MCVKSRTTHGVSKNNMHEKKVDMLVHSLVMVIFMFFIYSMHGRLLLEFQNYLKMI